MLDNETHGADARAEEVTADELEENLTEEAGETLDAENEEEAEALAGRVREGIAELFADGWTTEELAAFSQDAGARAAIAEGQSVARAACAYLRAAMSAAKARKRGVPTTRATAGAGESGENRIERMTDAQFDAFSKRAQEAMMAGRRVRM